MRTTAIHRPGRNHKASPEGRIAPAGRALCRRRSRARLAGASL
ncbi:Uncharacterized protein ChrSV_0285 [Chromobacterium vaccinii]|nr:Uncharacterized protein ChrSW_0285 [Chromobacterium vaccinii]QND87744.1 Uncharacterized protein ChrSV_0285 [Chromobacterium vaccinii]